MAPGHPVEQGVGKLVKTETFEEIDSLSIYQMNLIFNSQRYTKTGLGEKPGQNLGWMYYQLRDSYKNKNEKEKGEGGK